MINIQIEFLLTHESEVYTICRIPCVGEMVCVGVEGKAHEVTDVIHVLNADPEKHVLAMVRVKG